MTKQESENNNEDVSGKGRLLRNVITSWGAYLIFIVSGFVMPRLISDNVGQEALGVWDFSWAFVNYLSLSYPGIGTALDRFVPRYITKKEYKKLSETISSVILIQFVVGVVSLLITIIVSSLTPYLFADTLKEHTETARWIILFLGGSFALEMFFDTSRGLITGSHRWDLHNAISAVSRTSSVGGMMLALLLGGGLVEIAIVYFIVTFLTMLSRFAIARKVCSEARFSIKAARWTRAKEMLYFGLKGMVINMPAIILIQSVNIAVVASLGPAALAVFTRPVSLLKYVRTFISRFTFVLTPIAGSLQADGKSEELRRFIVSTTRYGTAISLPIVIYLAMFGDFLIELWMGPEYVNWELIIILSLGSIATISQQTVVRIVIGMNMHGKLGKVSLYLLLVIALIGATYFYFTGLSLIGAAWFIVIADVISRGLVVPWYACKYLGINIKSYTIEAFLMPLMAALVFTSILVVARTVFADDLLVAFLSGGLVGGIVILAIYWRFLLNEEYRNKVRLFVGRKLPRKSGH